MYLNFQFPSPAAMPAATKAAWRSRPLRYFLGWLFAGGLVSIGSGVQAQQLRYDQWRLQWAEEFDSAAIDTVELAQRWRFEYPWGRTLGEWETEYYTSRQLQVADGTLRLRAEHRSQPLLYRKKNLRYDAGMLFSHAPPDTLQPIRCPDQGGFSYGLFEIRCRQPRDAASWPAFWLFGGAPDEVDIFEANADAFGSTTHLNPNDYWRTASRQTVSCSCGYFATQPADLHNRFHVYSLAWLPGELVFYFDGVPIRRETRYAPLGCSMELIVNLAMTNWAHVQRDSLEVDYIRVYRPTLERIASEWMREEPQTDLESVPRTVPLGTADQTSRQRWQLTNPAGLRLALVDNQNPRCNTYMPLPLTEVWTPPWVQIAGESILELHNRVESQALQWQVRGLRGGPVLAQGQVASGEQQMLNWTSQLPPGAYVVTLQAGEAFRYQPLYVLDVDR